MCDGQKEISIDDDITQLVFLSEVVYKDVMMQRLSHSSVLVVDGVGFDEQSLLGWSLPHLAQRWV